MENMNDLIAAVVEYRRSYLAQQPVTGKAEPDTRLDHATNDINVLPFNLNDDLHIICVDDIPSIMYAAMGTQSLFKGSGSVLMEFPDGERYFFNGEEEEIPTMCGGNWSIKQAKHTQVDSIKCINEYYYPLRGYRFHDLMVEGITYRALELYSEFDALTLAKYLTISAAIAKQEPDGLWSISLSIGVEGKNVHAIVHVDNHDEAPCYDYDDYDEEDEYYDEGYTCDDEEVGLGWFRNSEDPSVVLDRVRAQPLESSAIYSKIPAVNINCDADENDCVFPEGVYSRRGGVRIGEQPIVRLAVQYYYGYVDQQPYHEFDDCAAILLTSNLGDPGWSTLDVMRSEPLASGYYRMSPIGYATNPNEQHHYIAAVVLLPHPTYVADVDQHNLIIREVSSDVKSASKAA